MSTKKFLFEFNDKLFYVYCTVVASFDWRYCTVEEFEPIDSNVKIPAAFFDRQIVKCAHREALRAFT